MRNLGALSLSVGTSLALEGEITKTLKSYDSFLINLLTVVRNAIEAYDNDDSDGKDVTLVSQAVVDDLMGMARFVQENQGSKSIIFTVFLPSYAGLPKLFPQANLWSPTKEKQLERAVLVKKVLDVVKKRLGTSITPVDSTPPRFSGNGVIFSHHPVDLVTVEGPTRLKLLESYTGTLKGFAQWYTKLTGKDQLRNMPLNKLTIQIFGDNATNFKSGSVELKNLVKRLAEEGRWTSASTVDKVKGSIKNYASAADRSRLLVLLN